MGRIQTVKRVTERELAQARARGYADREKQEDPTCPYLLPELRKAWQEGFSAAHWDFHYGRI